MTTRFLAAALLVCAAVPGGAQGWGGEGSDPNRSAASAEPAPKRAPKKEKEKEAAKPAGPDTLTDAVLDRSRALIDRQLAARKTRLSQRTGKFASYHIAMEKDRYAAEAQMAEEHRAFLLYLKSVPQEDRARAMSGFEERIAEKRKELDRRHLTQYKAWFDEEIADTWRSGPLSDEAVAAPAPSMPASAAAVEPEAAEAGEEASAPKPAAKAAPKVSPKPAAAAPASRKKIKKRATQ